jgi:predicted MPP superfamily phosphohydrolase
MPPAKTSTILGQFTKLLFATDLHGDLQDEGAVKKIIAFRKDFKPDVTVFGGDLLDLRAVRGGASEEEQNDSMLPDVAAGIKFLEEYKPNVFLWGNHDERLNMMMHSMKGTLRDLAEIQIEKINKTCRALKCKQLPYDKRKGVYQLGKLSMAHGFFAGLNVARTMANAYGSILFGHNHTIDVASIPRIEKTVGRCVGCLCQLDMPYNSKTVSSLRQAHGFAYGVVHKKTGDYYIVQAEKVGEEWITPDIK